MTNAEKMRKAIHKFVVKRYAPNPEDGGVKAVVALAIVADDGGFGEIKVICSRRGDPVKTVFLAEYLRKAVMDDIDIEEVD